MSKTHFKAIPETFSTQDRQTYQGEEKGLENAGKQAGIVYNPYKSIQENAKGNNVSIHTIRKYIRDNKISRREDEIIIKYNKVKALQEKGMTAKNIQTKLGYSLNTIKKYMAMDRQPDNKKESALDLTNKERIIKSVSYSQTEILKNIIRLYIDGNTFECDLTYSKGNFYNNNIPQPNYKYDIHPLSDEVRNLNETDQLEDSSISSIVFDLPFIVRRDKFNLKMSERFSFFKSVDELLNTNRKMLELSYRLLEKKGILVVKTMDVSINGSQCWTSHYVHSIAEKLGFQLLDIFVLIATTKIVYNVGIRQHASRKYHSYFYVFKKR